MTLSVHELQLRLKSNQPVRLVDVREPDEWKICHLPGATLIPLNALDARADEELKPEEQIVVYCHHGIRSSRAQHMLQVRGFQHVYNLAGGIEDWAREIDPTMPRY
jgi:rhodanese-related sulfurtransferase